MDLKRDEMFHFLRWINLLIGLCMFYMYVVVGGYYLLSLGFLNLAVWVFSRKVKLK